MKLHQRVLKFLDPKGEKRRKEYRECVAYNMAETEDLNRTISMKREDFDALMRKSTKLEEVHATIQFGPYAEICSYRYAAKESVLVVCKHPNHEAANTGVAPCRASVCPRLKEAVK